MFQVKSFLGCFKLETGGLVIGWLVLIQNILTLLVSILGIVVLSIYNCKELKSLLDKSQGRSGDTGEDFEKSCRFIKIIFFIAFVIVIVASLGFGIIAYTVCIKGTKARDHVRVKPMMILLAVAAVFSFLSVLSLAPSVVVSGLFYGLIYGYLFVVILSLMQTFKEEQLRGVTTHSHSDGKA